VAEVVVVVDVRLLAGFWRVDEKGASAIKHANVLMLSGIVIPGLPILGLPRKPNDEKRACSRKQPDKKDRYYQASEDGAIQKEPSV